MFLKLKKKSLFFIFVEITANEGKKFETEGEECELHAGWKRAPNNVSLQGASHPRLDPYKIKLEEIKKRSSPLKTCVFPWPCGKRRGLLF